MINQCMLYRRQPRAKSIASLICWFLLLFDTRAMKENYQYELREIPANFDERRTGVPPHVLYSPGPRHLESEIIVKEFIAQNISESGY